MDDWPMKESEMKVTIIIMSIVEQVKVGNIQWLKDILLSSLAFTFMYVRPFLVAEIESNFAKAFTSMHSSSKNFQPLSPCYLVLSLSSIISYYTDSLVTSEPLIGY